MKMNINEASRISIKNKHARRNIFLYDGKGKNSIKGRYKGKEIEELKRIYDKMAIEIRKYGRKGNIVSKLE